jgi:hypothetical protein
MRTTAGFASLLLCLQFAAAGGKPASGSYAGLKFIPAAGAKAKGGILVQPDGKVVMTTPVANLTSDAITDPSGAVVLRLAADGSVSGPGAGKQLRFNASDELSGGNGERVWLSPDGAMQLEMGGKTAPLPFKVEGVDAGNRRMAVLLGFYLYAQPQASSGSGIRATGPAKPDAAPEGEGK